ncbi:hypothetical protein [Rhodoferax sp.]|uniref:hypothetical protein n=1 Tax=Rhodoferax sp. TaxID=50421 RepID=UPI00284D24C1|nr:hypothetical protein [Rhodoferax sp.]MDR3370378.1 hypothetical protein [Rhodoferax sp.]
MNQSNGALMPTFANCLICFAAALLSISTSAAGQALRDPTIAPAAAGMFDSSGAQQDEALKSGSISVMTRGGVHYLMHGTRLYAKGQRIGSARIERISETEVWLRDDGQLQKIPLFNGVQRRAAVAPVAPKKPSVAPVLVRPAKITP